MLINFNSCWSLSNWVPFSKCISLCAALGDLNSHLGQVHGFDSQPQIRRSELFLQSFTLAFFSPITGISESLYRIWIMVSSWSNTHLFHWVFTVFTQSYIQDSLPDWGSSLKKQANNPIPFCSTVWVQLVQSEPVLPCLSVMQPFQAQRKQYK